MDMYYADNKQKKLGLKMIFVGKPVDWLSQFSSEIGLTGPVSRSLRQETAEEMIARIGSFQVKFRRLLPVYWSAHRP